MKATSREEPAASSHEADVLPFLEERYKRVVVVAGLIGMISVVIFMVAALGYMTYLGVTDLSLRPRLLRRLPVALGVPAAIVTAFTVVQVLRGFHGPIEFEIKGIRFSGATGPVILWMFVFLAAVWAIRILWGVEL